LRRIVVRRLVLGVLTLWVVSLLVFGATLALPGDPATAILGREATPERLAAVRENLHLNQSALSQYTHWLGGIVTFDPGQSIASQMPVTKVISEPLANTLWLMLVAGLVSIPLSIALGVFMAVKRDSVFDHASSTTTLVLAALPPFVLGIGTVVLFATQVFKWFPAVSLVSPGASPWDHPNVLVLPTLTLALVVVPYVSRIMRGSMVEVLESDYVTTARLKGLPERIVIWRHAVPNAIAPAIQGVALALAYMAGGIVIIEYVFNYPGVGSTLVDAVRNRDLPVVQFIVMLVATTYVVLNLVADLATAVVTPKLRTATA
jgi:peptide/nickel transport system permease protein